MIVTAHQPNLLPAWSVMSKIKASDAVIWLDEVQFTKGGFTNRQPLPGGGWLTVPVEKHCAFKPINRVRLASPGDLWRAAVRDKLWAAWGSTPAAFEIAEEILRPYRLLVGLNMSILATLCRELDISARWHMQSHLDGGHAVVNVSEDREQLRPISERLALMVEEVGGSVYLSGPSGRNYLDETPFSERGIEVRYWRHDDPNPCALALLHDLREVAA